VIWLPVDVAVNQDLPCLGPAGFADGHRVWSGLPSKRGAIFMAYQGHAQPALYL